ncbi:haloacid dehalogenase superfamily, subfamily IA, variant 3 with third motif having DD or ED [Agreia bicolorata]|uniref:Haloacid dehalogenase superfamily, subfamily IA, variant 3 with third motif having DD or ED n=1 Tax=Agreia bicolorata TaxID=110935 RepID=A0A1T4X5H4_9MICO|nr:haloacid dehalogenase superfamily, subfamily IA, variant 3 with third motif having DD or ED [Agreia bicolorata]
MTPMPAAVLWDMDGTIVDTEPYWMRSQEALVSRFGGVWTHDDAMTLVGSGLDRTARLLQERGVDMQADEIIDHLTHEVMTLISVSVPWRPGARELLSALRESSVPCALVTMSFGVMAEHVRSFIPFDAFDAVVSGDSVENSKPHPEAYLEAARLLGVPIEDCVAFEDSVPGVTSAAASGAVTIGVPHLLPLENSPASVLWPTLAGRTVDDVGAALQAHRRPGAIHPTTGSRHP